MPYQNIDRRKFRNDINGLRAWAVVSVVLYHFGAPGFGGGFVGVDVFFVISGFLMTSIVVLGLERGGSLSLFVMSFYMARARRILPALIVLCAVLLIFGWWVLMPPDYKMLGTHVVFSVTFLSNIKFWRESGYFDAASHEKLLLHTWSLAVEWQFYLILPLILLAVWKLHASRKAIIAVTTLSLVVSLGLCVALTPLNPSFAFYLLPARAWEMLAGGLVYLVGSRFSFSVRQSRTLEGIGLTAILGAVVVFDTSSNWPGWRAIVPVAGAVAVLLASRSDSFWTCHRIAQWLGTRSYSIYLWHWPVVVVLTYLTWQGNATAIATGLAITLVMGHLSYQWVEKQGQKQLGQLRLGLGATTLVCTVMLLAASGGWIRVEEGFGSRLPGATSAIIAAASDTNPRQAVCHPSAGITSPSCIYGGNKVRAVLLGDSHADAVVTALAAASSNPNDGVMDWSYSSCPTIDGALPTDKLLAKLGGGYGYDCNQFLARAMQQLLSLPTEISVVIVNRTSAYAFGRSDPWERESYTNVPLVYFQHSYTFTSPPYLAEFAQQLTDTACQLAKNRVVYLVRPIPEMAIDVPKAMAGKTLLSVHKSVSISLSEYHRRHAFVWSAQDAARDRCGVKILDPLPYLCWNGRCHGAKEGRPLYYDDDHLNEFGNKLLVPMFREVFMPQVTMQSPEAQKQ